MPSCLMEKCTRQFAERASFVVGIENAIASAVPLVIFVARSENTAALAPVLPLVVAVAIQGRQSTVA